MVSQGALIVRAGGSVNRLERGDAILFQADVPHSYEKPGAELAVVYLVMTYAQEIGGGSLKLAATAATPTLAATFGGIAQLVERLVRKGYSPKNDPV